MKLAVRIFALSVVFAGVAAASLTSAPKAFAKSHQAANSAMPIPCCGPHLGCSATSVK